MSRTTPRARTPIRSQLRESSTVGKPDRVDRDRGVIYGVKILGRRSFNNHGVKGATRSEYTREALAAAKPLYEGRQVNVDHPDRTNPGRDRSSRDRIGWLSNVRDEDDGLFGDLNLLKSYPLSASLFEAAERNPSLFGLSHNAMGDGQVVDGVYVISAIPVVRHVDIVADGGTVRSLFESLGELELDDGKSSSQGGDDYALHEALADAIKAVLCDSSISLSEKKTRIMKLVEVSGEPDPDEDDDDMSDEERTRKAMSQQNDQDKGKGKGKGDSPPADGKGKDTKESREQRIGQLQTELVQLRESLGGQSGKKKVKKLEKKLAKLTESGNGTGKLAREIADLKEARRQDAEKAATLQSELDKLQLEKWIRDEAATKKVVVDEVLESLVAMGTKEAIGKHLDYLAKHQAPRTPPRRPQSAPPRPITESRNGTPATDKPEETLATLRS